MNVIENLMKFNWKINEFDLTNSKLDWQFNEVGLKLWKVGLKV